MCIKINIFLTKKKRHVSKKISHNDFIERTNITNSSRFIIMKTKLKVVLT